MTASAQVLCIGIDPSGLGVGERPRLDKIEMEFTVLMDRQGVRRALNHLHQWDLVICRSSAFYDLAVDRFLIEAEGALAASLILVCPPASTLSPAEAASRGAADSVMNGDREHLEMVMARELATSAMRKRLAALDCADSADDEAVALPKMNGLRPRSSNPPASREHPHLDALAGARGTQPTPAEDDGTQLDDRQVKRLIDGGGLTLEYQPIVALQRHEESAGAMFEVLLRLRDEHGALLLPSRFFPAAARHDWLGRLDLWVFRQALTMLSRIQASAGASTTTGFFVNLSTETLAFPASINAIVETIDKAQIQDGSIRIEIKRELLTEQPAALDHLQATLQQHDHGLLLEQVGLADAALLKQHAQALTHIKLKPALLHALATGAVNESDVTELIRIARDHGLTVIALAVDSADILPSLYAVGVHAIQGNFVSMPYAELVYPDVFSISP